MRTYVEKQFLRKKMKYPLIGVRYGEYSPQTLSNKKSQLITVSDNINVIIRIGVLELVGCSVTSIKNQKLREKWPKKHQKMAKKVGHAWKSVISSHIEEQFNIDKYINI